ncbi:MAG: E3 binding domain-containing protein, partial [Candidatus Eremiobacteraeota bacterium]|nr:E3 binding domain-containing protein [Candidatus Eremiobacteraeota bacterium]
MAQIEVRVPNIGDFAEVPIVDVLVGPGDAVAVEDPLVTLESDKATMEVPSSQAGTVQNVAVKVGDKVSEGSVLLTLDAAEATRQTDAQTPNGALKPSAAAVAPPSQPAQARSSAAPSSPENASNRPAAAEPASYGAHPETPPAAQPDPRPEPTTEQPASENGVVHASPSIRRFARELGVALESVRGTGPHARITRDDVANYVKSALAAPPAARTGTGAAFDVPPLPKIDLAKFGPIESVPLSRIRKLS